LVERFVVDHPLQAAPALVDRGARAFLDSGGEIKAVLRAILLDGLARPDFVLPPKFKRPTDFVASALRLLQAESDGGPAIQSHLSAMGQGLFDWPTPDGPPDFEGAWASNLLPRWSFALELAQNRIAGSHLAIPELLKSAASDSPGQSLQAFSLLLLGKPAPVDVAAALSDAFDQTGADPMEDIPAVIIAGLLASPAFQWR
jgi:hypothetical protein